MLEQDLFWASRTVAEIRVEQVKQNFNYLLRNWQGGVAMVKCNAYGHGLAQTAKALESLSGLVAFGVATIEEGAVIRRAGVRKPVWVFSECAPWSEELAHALEHYALTPVIHDLSDLRAALEPKYSKLLGAVGVQLKFNTGMNRLGVNLEDAAEARRVFQNAGVRPQGICSHLASSDDPRGRLTRQQVARFKEIVSEFSSLDVSYIHCSNTDAILEDRTLGLSKFCNLMRPGLGLYGYAASDAKARQLKTALTWRARVLSTRKLKAGDYVGYGGSYRAKQSLHQAVLGIGYGDGLKRTISNKSLHIGLGSRQLNAKVLGRVSMDLMAINIRANPGDWVTLLGEGPKQGKLLANQSETVVYEVLTSISPRVPRIHL